jgi:hypothetical protein
MDLFYIRLFALQCLMPKNEKSLDVPKILLAKKTIFFNALTVIFFDRDDLLSTQDTPLFEQDVLLAG